MMSDNKRKYDDDSEEDQPKKKMRSNNLEDRIKDILDAEISSEPVEDDGIEFYQCDNFDIIVDQLIDMIEEGENVMGIARGLLNYINDPNTFDNTINFTPNSYSYSDEVNSLTMTGVEFILTAVEYVIKDPDVLPYRKRVDMLFAYLYAIGRYPEYSQIFERTKALCKYYIPKIVIRILLEGRQIRDGYAFIFFFQLTFVMEMFRDLDTYYYATFLTSLKSATFGSLRPELKKLRPTIYNFLRIIEPNVYRPYDESDTIHTIFGYDDDTSLLPRVKENMSDEDRIALFVELKNHYAPIQPLKIVPKASNYNDVGFSFGKNMRLKDGFRNKSLF
jgi:hypothetical protein